MKQIAFILIMLIFSIKTYSQRLGNVLEGFIINKIATDMPVVGAKYVIDIGATTEGFTADNLIESKSIDYFSLNKENRIGLEAGLKAVLNIGFNNPSDLNIEITNLEIVKVKDLYNLSLVKDEMLIYEAIKANSFILTFNKNIEAKIKAELPLDANIVEVDASGANQKKLKISGANLFIAYKIIKIDKVTTQKTTKKINDSFIVTNIVGYDVSFNIKPLIAKVEQEVLKEIGHEKYKKIEHMDMYVTKYSEVADITVSILSSTNGTTTTGIFKRIVNFCYCQANGDINNRLFLINTVNTGKKITFDNLLIDNFSIAYSKHSNFVNAVGDPVTIKTFNPANNSKITIISKTYTISNFLK